MVWGRRNALRRKGGGRREEAQCGANVSLSGLRSDGAAGWD